ncbi:MAG: bifunctional phosphoribosyl-AMP cyclohydrolase/phosphoribosyl-ATP diphosphatase HisIE [Solirubrobacteraceae bacterium]|nr:bifunctional phosphoribosyl-AMP cyclohydrolase/phosphoribosyl-ATP diphosphatase HisIE [Solirubrobacteraceae bacterium]
MEPSYDQNGLVAVIAQDHATGEVLMFAYANEEAVRLTQQTGELHLWSRSRNELWHKGATSGNILKVRDLRIDCDGDALLAIVEPAGPACHTGERTCFYRRLEDGAAPQLTPHEALPALARTFADRKASPSEDSWTAKLLADPTLAGEKVEEEAEEVVRAAREETDDRVDNEAADLLYHLLAVLSGRGRTYTDAFEVLLARRR